MHRIMIAGLLVMLSADRAQAQAYPWPRPGSEAGGGPGGGYFEAPPRYMRPFRESDDRDLVWRESYRGYGSEPVTPPGRAYPDRSDQGRMYRGHDLRDRDSSGRTIQDRTDRNRASRDRREDDDDEDENSNRRQPRHGDTDVPRGQKVMDGGAQPEIRPVPPQPVQFAGRYAPGTIVIETSGRQLLLITGKHEALRYPISVGRQGFTWTGSEKISRIADWPDWHPPEQMRQRDPKLPEKMTGGLRNPLGAKSLYLGDTLYRIHGTNDAKTIGYASSSGCFRMLNGHVVDLAGRVRTGTTVVVVDRLPRDVVMP